MADKKAKKYYEIKKDKNGKQHIVIDFSVVPTDAEAAEVEFYSKKLGFEVKKKSQARVAAMKEKADGLNAEAIKEALKGDKAGLTKFEAIMEGKDKEYKKGFFAAKKWFKAYKEIE